MLTFYSHHSNFIYGAYEGCAVAAMAKSENGLNLISDLNADSIITLLKIQLPAKAKSIFHPAKLFTETITAGRHHYISICR